jgi:fucose permease
VGVLSGYFIFAAFVDNADPASAGWLNVYYLLTMLVTVAFVLLVFARLDESSAQHEAEPLADDLVGMFRLCIRPLVLVFVISAFLYVLIEQSIMSWLPTFNSRVLNLSPSLSIQMASILAAATALGRFTAGFLLKRIDWFRVLACGLVAAAILVLVTLPMAGVRPEAMVMSWRDVPLAAIIFPFIGFCIAPIYPAINSVILTSLPLRDHAPMAGLIVVFSALGGTSGSMLTGSLFELLGGQAAFYFSLVPITAVLFTLALFKRRTEMQVPNDA